MADIQTILMVDDEEDSLSVLLETLMLCDLGNVSFRQARSGEEAAHCIAGGGIDVVLADILMPGISGFELLQQCTARGFYLPFIFVTSLEGRDAAIQALRLGAFDFIKKPVFKAALEAPLRKALSVSRAFQNLGASLASDPQLEHFSEDLRQMTFEIRRMQAMRFQKVKF